MLYRSFCLFVWAGLLLALAERAEAVDVYLNGSKITGQAGLDFGRVKVKLDAKGNVRIHAPEYQVQELSTGKPSSADREKKPQPALTHQYFVVTECVRTGITGYEIELSINGNVVKSLPDTVAQQVVELNDHLHPGQNTLHFRALRKGRTSLSENSQNTFSVLVGVGNASSGQLNIENVLYEFKVSAADSGEITKTYLLHAK
jgi:hypothetical protein